MIYVYLSEHVLNSFFYQIDSYAFLRINLHRIPEIETLLKLECDEDEDCFGKHFKWTGIYEPNSGKIIKK